MMSEIEELNAESPLRLLGQAAPGAMGRGRLGVVLARAGVGKTTFLVQIGLDFLLRGESVLHVTISQTVEQVQARYDAVFDELAADLSQVDRERYRAELAKRRMISAFADQRLAFGRLEETAEVLHDRLDFRPKAIVVDSCDWGLPDAIQTAAALGGAKSYCRLRGAELWVSGQTHRETVGEAVREIPPPCAEYGALVDAAIFLDPHPQEVQLHIIKGGGEGENHILRLDPDSLRIPEVGEKRVRAAASRLPASGHTLLSGGAGGAESEFGRQAEAWRVQEVNFTCEGRKPARTRNLVLLDEEDLAQGAVSEVYLQAHMKRTYPDTELFRRTLQTIWHQVKTASEVFVVGLVQADGTVRGGTGWAAELGRHWHKPVYVFDQEREVWFSWTGEDWVEVEAPQITTRRFCGTGTRFLTDAGRAAIEGLFERSFGK